jgi:ATP-dependent exoDNAse (exonuclease V) alpha subunit
MAVYFLYMKTFGRANGSSAPGAIAYRAGERIRDERTGRIYDHSNRRDVMHKEIILPGKFAGADVAWAKDRAVLWNAAEEAESRKNARVAREYLVALPAELAPEQRLGLVRGYAQDLADRYRYAVDFAIHAPRDDPRSDPRNYHAHLLTTTREVTLTGLGSKTTLDMNDTQRRELGLKAGVHELLFAREHWAATTNEALRAAHLPDRVDHRSLRAQGIDREPRPQIPRAAFEIDRRGEYSVVAERMQADHQLRVQARRDLAAAAHNVAPPSAAAVKNGTGSQTLEEIRREARQAWLQLRQQQQSNSTPSPVAAPNHSRDDDLSR